MFGALLAAHGACGSSEDQATDAGTDAGPQPSFDAGEADSNNAGIRDATADADADVDADAAVSTVCGDGVIEGDEECEDGSPEAGDGCDTSCHLEPGYECPTIGQPCTPTVCGDGDKRGTEDCDDGNFDWGDACTPLCTLAPICANGTCTPICGDGIVSQGEECDDGNKRPFDGCSATCTVEPGFTCALEAAATPLDLTIVHRDFRGYDLPAADPLPRGHIDFENANSMETGIVTADLGANGKPVYAKDGNTSATTHGAAAFNQWFRDVDLVNIPVVGTFSLTMTAPETYRFDAPAYFPLDDAGFPALGQEPKRDDSTGTSRNFSFTSESRAWFTYTGSEVITVRGDDDIWLFVNGRLAIDLGGVHGPADGTVTLSLRAAQLGLTVNGIYELAIFRAERHTSGSSFRLQIPRPVRRSTCTPTGT